MSFYEETLGSADPVNGCGSAMMITGHRSRNTASLHVCDWLRIPHIGELRRSVQALLLAGERRIVLDLARVPRIDAAGVGELVRAYNMTTAVDGMFSIVHETRFVREILVRVGLFDRISATGTDAAGYHSAVSEREPLSRRCFQ
jgi:anti-anti-sigma factor